MDIREHWLAYRKAVEPALHNAMLPENSMVFVLGLLHQMKPDLVIEHGVGWSTVLLADFLAGKEFMVVEPHGTWRSRIADMIQHRGIEWTSPQWFIHSGAEWIGHRKFFLLLDGPNPRVAITESLASMARYGVVFIDDAQDSYARDAALCLPDLADGALYDIRIATEAQRNQKTWAWLWIGDYSGMANWGGLELCARLR